MVTKVLTDAINRFTPGWGCLEACLGVDFNPYTNRDISNHSAAIKAIVKEVLQNDHIFNPVVNLHIDAFILDRIDCHPEAWDRVQCVGEFVEKRFTVVEALPREPDVLSVASNPIGKSKENSRYIIIVNSDRTVQNLRTKVIQEIFYIVLQGERLNSQECHEVIRGAMSLCVTAVLYYNIGFCLESFLAAPGADCVAFGVCSCVNEININDSKRLAEMYESKTR